jgi:hypothetical protein
MILPAFGRLGRWTAVVSGLLLTTLAWGQPTIQRLGTNGPSANRINLVFLSEGYSTNDLARFTGDAQRVLDELFATSPYNEYQSLFNVSIISVASNESGSDHPSAGIYRDTYFNSKYESYGVDRLVTIPPNDVDSDYSHGAGKVMQLLQQFAPDYDIAALIVNDSTYGGSGGAIAITSVNDSSPEIIIHELGHSFAHLGDEYGDPYPGYPDTEEPNTTRQTDRSLIKWHAWIEDETPIPTPQTSDYNSVAGLFEGAHYHYTGWYRPQLDCKMRSLGIGFCAVCAETLVLSDYRLVRPVESWSPASTNLTLPAMQPLTFSVAPVTPQRHSLTVQWSVDGVTISGATNTDFPSPVFTSAGTHVVQAKVNDPTQLVRNDPSGLLAATVGWNLTITGGVVPPRFASPELLAGGVFRFTVTGDAGANFVLETSGDLQNWTPVLTNTIAGDGFVYTAPVAPAFSTSYYRAQLR